MTEREKMIEIINSVQAYGIMSNAFGGELPVTNEMLADALIEAGIGDVKETEHRAARAERALQKFAETITCEDCPFSSDCASSEKMEDLIHSSYCFAEYLRQAEKELAEERKQ